MIFLSSFFQNEERMLRHSQFNVVKENLVEFNHFFVGQLVDFLYLDTNIYAKF